MPISNDRGRSLEYVIARRIIDSMPSGHIRLTDTAQKSQQRDEPGFRALPRDLKEQFEHYSVTVFGWLEEKFGISKLKVVLDRLTDRAAVAGDVTDIRLTIGKRDINLSIKHNHSALKHQRPPTVATQCGYPEGSKEDLEYRKKYQNIIKSFLADAKRDHPAAKEFNQIKSESADYIDTHLYRPVCMLVSHTINTLCGDKPGNTKHLFKFLVGNTDFYKIKASEDEVHIQEFADISDPVEVKATVAGDSYVNLTFSNRWEMGMRLHTAATKLGSSLKFDTQLQNSPVPTIDRKFIFR